MTEFCFMTKTAPSDLCHADGTILTLFESDYKLQFPFDTDIKGHERSSFLYTFLSLGQRRHIQS